MEKKHNGEDLRPFVREHFVLSIPEYFENSRLNSVYSVLSSELKTIGLAFDGNISGVLSIICMPFTMALASVYDRELIVETIPHYILHGTILAPHESEERVKKRLKNKSSEDLGEQMGKQVCIFLYKMHKSTSTTKTSGELLRQGTVLIWGALEALVRDLLERLANVRPSFGKQLLESPSGKKLFQNRIFDIDTLARYNYDISNKIGSIIIQNIDLSNLGLIKMLCDVMFPNNERLRKALSDRNLWVMNQRRHNIVHNCGIIDAKYIDSTGESIPAGQKLIVCPNDIIKYVAIVQEVGAELFEASNAVLS